MTSQSETPGVLHEVRVLDLSTEYAGALVGAALADHGAQVIHLERPGALETFAHRGKRRVRWGGPRRDEALIEGLVARADVILEDAPARALLAHQACEDTERGRIHCWVPPFAPDHELAALRGPDGAVEAAAGLHEVPLGRAPSYHSLSLLSVASAGWAVCGVLAALVARRRDGRGQRVRVARSDVAYALLELHAMFTRRPPRSWVTLQWAATPFIGAYQGAEGRWLYLHAGLRRHLPRLLEALRAVPAPTDEPVARLERLIDERTRRDPTSVPSLKRVRRIQRALAEVIACWPAPRWERVLSEAGLCAVLVRSPLQWREHAHPRQAGQIVEVDGRLMPGPLARLGATPGGARPASGWAPERAQAAWPARDRAPLDRPPEQRPPLEGVRVLDFTQVIAGPVAGRVLAELGARVHHVANPRLDAPWVEPFHIAFQAGKTSEALDLRAPAGRARLEELLGQLDPDVLVQNWRPGAAAGLGLDEPTVRQRCPEIVYAHLTAYGERGPWARRPGWEQTAQAATGIQHLWGGAGPPQLFPLPCNDVCTGLHGAQAVLLGLLARDQGRGGQRVGADLTSTATWMLGRAIFDRAPLARGRSALGAGPLQGFYEAADGWLYLCALDPEAAFEIPGLERARGASGRALMMSLRVELARHPVATWMARVEQAGLLDRIFLAPRRTQGEVLGSARAERLGLVARRSRPGLGGVTVTGSALVLERTPTVALDAAPPLEVEAPRPSALGWLRGQLVGAAALAANRSGS